MLMSMATVKKPDAEMHITVKSLDGQTTQISISGHETIRDLKQALLQNPVFKNRFQNFHLFYRGSRLNGSSEISSLTLQGNDFIVIIPFTKALRREKHANLISNSVLDSGKNSTGLINNEDALDGTYSHSLRADVSNTNQNSIQGLADSMWDDVFSDISEMKSSSQLADGLGSQNNDKDSNNVPAKDYLQTEKTCVPSSVAKSVCSEILDKLECSTGKQCIVTEGSTTLKQVRYPSRISKLVKDTDMELKNISTKSKEDSELKQSDDSSYPLFLKRQIKVFVILNIVSGFLEKYHMQATWSNIKSSLKQLSCEAFEEVTVKEIEMLATLCPKILMLLHSEPEADGESNEFSIHFYDSSWDYMQGKGGLRKFSEKSIINTITRRQRAYEAHVETIVKQWQTWKGSTKELLDVPTFEDLKTMVTNMQESSNSPNADVHMRQNDGTTLERNKKCLCLDTDNLLPPEMVEHLRAGLGSKGQIVHVENINPRKPKYSDIPITLSESTKAAFKKIGISKFYSHQCEAIKALLSEEDIVIATSTASGKSLCYNVPVLENLSLQHSSCALYLFPTKALAQDQLRVLTEMTQGLNLNIDMGIYDGDTPHAQRMWLRNNARLLITNPDMLHLTILPAHKQFQRILSNLRFLILDEAHAYKGAFGCHTAFILRRLCRICLHLYNITPRFIISSATIANPREHAMDLANLKAAHAILEDGSPCGSKCFILWNPPLQLDPKNLNLKKSKRQKVGQDKIPVTADISVKRSSSILEASYIFAEFVQHGLRSIAFCNTRKLSELVLSYTQEILKESAPHLIDSVCVYRAGYTAQERRKIEHELFVGNLLGVAATNALELGIDVGNLDATLHLGFPGSVASLWQQAGRSGRREKSSISVYIAFDGPLDQHFMKHPHKLFSRSIEHCHIDVCNPKVINQHLACAALEFPVSLKHDQKYFGNALNNGIFELRKEGLLGKHPDECLDDEVWHYIGKKKHPASLISIRAIDPEKYTVIDQSTNDVIEEIEESKAFFEVYEGAVYMNQGKTYLVTSLDLSAKIAMCQKSDVKYYTKTRDFTDIYVTGADLAYPGKILDAKHCATSAQVNLCKVTTKWFGFRRIWRGSNQVFDTVDLFLPEYSYESQAVWIRVPKHIKTEIGQLGLSFRAGLHAASHALQNILPLYIPCNPSDLGAECANPHDSRYFPERLLLYDRHPGGIGIVAQAWRVFPDLLHAALELIVTCECLASTGCPNCIQNFACGEYNEVIDKQAATIILEAVIKVEDVARSEGN